MEQKKFTQKFKILPILAFAMLIGQNMLGQTVISYDLNTSSWSSTTTTPPSLNTGTFSCNATSPTLDGSAWAYATGWDTSGHSWSSSVVSTVGYSNVYVTFYMKSDPTGPKSFDLQYKTSAGGTWITAATFTNIVPTSGSVQKTAYLPSGASNQSTLYIQWIQNGIASSSTAKNYISGVNVTAAALLYPAVQSSAIKIIARTSNTITVSWTKGGAQPQLLMINNINDFTPLPVNNEIFNPITGQYNGSGRAVIFNTTDGNAASTFTVQVPSATDTYWFRVFDYQYNAGLTRYGPSEYAAAVDYAPTNPVKCYLEQITLNDAYYKLVTADIGATIAPKRGTITERGILYSTKQNFIDTDPEAVQLMTDNLNLDGYFHLEDFLYDQTYSYLQRGQTIYYKAYVKNQYGTIFTDEKSFNNSPIFSGIGNWEDGTKWNVHEIPGSTGTVDHASVDDKPTINGACTLTASNSVTNLTINSGKNLTISPAVDMNVVGTLTNSAGTSGILIKSSSTLANGSLRFGSGNPSGSVEMYSKANWNFSNPVNNKYKWQYFGLPVKTITANSTFSNLLGNNGSSSRFVREWDESSVGYFDAWVLAGDGLTSLYKTGSSNLDQNHGYELVQQNPTTYTFAGELLNTDYIQSLSYSSGAAFAGQHIFGNPYTAAIKIANFQFGTNTEQAVYLYNTGTYNDWSSSNGVSAPGNGPGQYTVSTPGTAGGGGVPSQIPTAGSFLVKSINATGSITITKSTGLVANSDQQRVKSLAQTTSDKVNTRIDVIGQNFSDRMWIFTFPTCTRNFDNGFDGRKMLGIAGTTQLYSIENDGVYQINAVNDMNESYLGFQPGNDTQFKLVFNHENTSSIYGSIYLVDLIANKTVDITQSGTEYAFTAAPTDATTRFKIVTQTTGTANPTDNSAKLKVFNTNEAIYVQNFTDKTAMYTLYNASGKLMQRLNINANTIKTISTQGLNAGVFVANSETETEKVTQRLIIR